MIRLENHDEIVEAIRLKIRWELGCDLDEEVERDVAAATLDALLAAVVELKVGRSAISTATKDTWLAETCLPGAEARDGDFPALILKLEPKP
jgi:hypothetical protein